MFLYSFSAILHTHFPQLGSPFREPVLKFALKFPTLTIDFFLCRLFDTSLSRLFASLLRHKDGGPLRDVLAASPHKIISTTFSLSVSTYSRVLSRGRGKGRIFFQI